MSASLPTTSDWQSSTNKLKIKDNGIRTALGAYENIDDAEHDDRIKVLDSVRKLATALLVPFENTLKKNKADKAASAAADYLNDLVDAAKSTQAEIVKDKALAAKTQALADKAEKDVKKKEQEGDGEDDEDEQGEFFEVLKRTIQSMKTAKKPFYFQVCDAKPYGLIISKKDIRKSAQHRKQLSQIAGGSTRAPKVGECRVEGGNKLVLEMEKAAPELPRILRKWLKESLSLVLKVQVGEHSADDDEDPADAPPAQPGARTTVSKSAAEQGNDVVDIGSGTTETAAGADKPKGKPAGGGRGAAAVGSDQPAAPGAAAAEPTVDMKAPFAITGSVGQGCKNKPADVQAVQIALNLRAKAGLQVNGKCDAKTIAAINAFQQTMGRFKPDGVIEVGRATSRALAGAVKIGPPPEAPKPVPVPTLGKGTLDKAPDAWHNTRNIVQTNIGELKKAVRSHYSAEHPDLLKEIEKNLKKLDGILEKLDTKLAESLASAKTAKNDSERQTHLKNSKAILTNYITYVKSEPLIDHIDKNPWGVQTNIKKSLSATMMHLAQAIGK